MVEGSAAVSLVYETTGLEDLQRYFAELPKVSRRAARLAINQVAQRGGMKLIVSEMMDEVSFPKGYLTGDRLRIAKYASEGDLEATIVARKRATSLARFAANASIGGKGGVRVRVGKSSTNLRNAWLVRLNRGASKTEDNYNVGLALRVGSDREVANKYSAHESWLAPGVALLYGPSVDQVFRSVAEDVAEPIGEQVADEFFRQLERLST